MSAPAACILAELHIGLAGSQAGRTDRGHRRTGVVCLPSTQLWTKRSVVQRRRGISALAGTRTDLWRFLSGPPPEGCQHDKGHAALLPLIRAIYRKRFQAGVAEVSSCDTYLNLRRTVLVDASIFRPARWIAVCLIALAWQREKMIGRTSPNLITRGNPGLRTSCVNVALSAFHDRLRECCFCGLRNVLAEHRKRPTLTQIAAYVDSAPKWGATPRTAPPSRPNTRHSRIPWEVEITFR